MKKPKVENKRRIIVIIVMIIVTAFLTAGSFAWYLNNTHKGVGRDVEVMTPYFLYLMNAEDKQSLEFAVGNLHPGENKRVIICVTNERPENEQDNNTVKIARESRFYYDLEFAYTENLAVDYNVYELTKELVEEDGTIPDNAIVMDGITDAYWVQKDSIPLSMDNDVSEERQKDSLVFGNGTTDTIWNAGKYILYQKNTDGEALDLEYAYDETAQSWEYEYDYYMVEITWKQDDNIKFTDYSKETDLVYVIVNAKQVMPTTKE